MTPWLWVQELQSPAAPESVTPAGTWIVSRRGPLTPCAAAVTVSAVSARGPAIARSTRTGVIRGVVVVGELVTRGGTTRCLVGALGVGRVGVLLGRGAAG